MNERARQVLCTTFIKLSLCLIALGVKRGEGEKIASLADPSELSYPQVKFSGRGERQIRRGLTKLSPLLQECASRELHKRRCQRSPPQFPLLIWTILPSLRWEWTRAEKRKCHPRVSLLGTLINNPAELEFSKTDR